MPLLWARGTFSLAYILCQSIGGFAFLNLKSIPLQSVLKKNLNVVILDQERAFAPMINGDWNKQSRLSMMAKSEMGSNGLTEIEQLFETLVTRENVPRKVRLEEDTVGSRTVTILEDAKEGEVILSVPGRLCLWANRDGTIEGLEGQSDATWAVAGDLRATYPDVLRAQGLTWDLRLAVALLEASIEQRCAGGFWDVYGFLLPAAHTVTMPICFPSDLKEEIQNEFMVKAAAQQDERVRSHFPTLTEPGYHPKLQIYQDLGMTKNVPNALMWCFALVRSRVFSANPERFAFVPFLDMCNHWVEPNADYKYNEETDSFDLFALRPLQKGEEIYISYGNNLSNDDLFMRYGFVIPGNPIAIPFLNYKRLQSNDPGVKLNDFEASQLENMQSTLISLASLSIQSDEDRIEVTRLKGILPVLSFLISRHESGDLRTAIKSILEVLTRTAKAEFTTTIETDRQQLEKYQKEKGTDARLLAAVEYRSDRKKQFRVAMSSLGTMIEILESQQEETEQLP